MTHRGEAPFSDEEIQRLRETTFSVEATLDPSRYMLDVYATRRLFATLDAKQVELEVSELVRAVQKAQLDEEFGGGEELDSAPRREAEAKKKLRALGFDPWGRPLPEGAPP